MINLKELCRNLNCQIIGNINLPVKGISYHSQKIKPSHLFVAIDGYKTSGKQYIDSAIQNGAKVIATSDLTLARKSFNQHNQQITIIYTPNPREFLARTANRFYAFPSKKINLIGITGTDGKTTTSYMIKSIIEASGKKTGLLGTIKYYNGKSWLPAPNTTPESLEFIKFLNELVKKNIQYCISEVSSHALALDRVNGLDFKVGVFTNLAHDHLDFHKTKKAYGDAKLKLFKNLSKSAYAVLNNDDKLTEKIVKSTQAKITRYSMMNKSDVRAKVKSVNVNGYDVLVNIPNQIKPQIFQLPMLGIHNIYNMLAAVTTAKVLGINKKYIKQGVNRLKPIPGRLEKIPLNNKFNVYIDYAHTEKALHAAIRALKEITSGRVVVVFGCGGNRDCAKRPRMGKTATELADYVIITSDNPRNENPEMIIKNIKNGITKNNFEVIANRRKAINRALKMAKPHDSVLIAGKGHEDYQIIGNRKVFFSDKETVLKKLKVK